MSSARFLIAFVVIAAAAVACSATPPASPSPPPNDGAITEMPTSLPQRTPLENAVKDHYARLFNEPVFRPAIVNDSRYVNCVGQGHLTTTLYLPEPGRACRDSE